MHAAACLRKSVWGLLGSLLTQQRKGEDYGPAPRVTLERSA